MTEATELRAADALDDTTAQALRDKLVGSWTTELDNEGKPAFGLSQFSADGGVIAMQITTKNIGLGSWKATGPNSFEYAFHILAAGENGEFVGEAHVRVNGTFVSDTRWEGTGGAAFYAPDGKQLSGHTGNTVVGNKFGV
jgi:hypothetical protein